MSTAVKEKKPFLPQRKPAAQAGSAIVRAGAGPAPRIALGASPLTFGGEPRVHLLPADVAERKGLRLLKRRLLTAIVAVWLIAACAYGAVAYTLATAQAQLTNAQSQTSALLTEQGKYGEVTKIKADIGSIQTAQKTATAQEILWAPYVVGLEGTLPSGAAITNFDSKIDAPFTAAPVAPTVIPLQGSHIATITVTLSMQQTTIPGWLNTLPTTKGFVDDTLDSVTSVGNGGYTVIITLFVDEQALSNRFTKVGEATK